MLSGEADHEFDHRSGETKMNKKLHMMLAVEHAALKWWNNVHIRGLLCVIELETQCVTLDNHMEEPFFLLQNICLILFEWRGCVNPQWTASMMSWLACSPRMR